MRLITDENVDKLLGMSYSNNISKLLQVDKSPKDVIPDYVANMKYKLQAEKRMNLFPNENPILPDESDFIESESTLEQEDSDYASYEPNSPEYAALPQSPDESIENLAIVV